MGQRYILHLSVRLPASIWSSIEKLSRESALEVRATGAHWTFTPNIDVARDARWGRTGETFGEDPYLVTRMGVATIKGYQGENCLGVMWLWLVPNI